MRAGARPVAGVLDQRCASIQRVGEETVDHPRALAATRPATVARVAVFSRILTKSRTMARNGQTPTSAGRKGSHYQLRQAIAVDQLGYSLSGGDKKYAAGPEMVCHGGALSFPVLGP
ncbi:hypothetical protein AOQ73_28175 [Bradyrhizobium pachyrhizi]|nr:hypothetical protein AOQ73_28175 [Bradyrhizobium pachyrhizi]